MIGCSSRLSFGIPAGWYSTQEKEPWVLRFSGPGRFRDLAYLGPDIKLLSAGPDVNICLRPVFKVGRKYWKRDER
jgi:hypothetical protein